MAYADIGDKSSGDTITEANWDQIRANFQASAIDIVTTKGDIAVATAADTLSRLAVGSDHDEIIADSGETTGLAYRHRPSVRVYNSGNYDPTAATWESVTFDSERWDTDTLHDTSTNTDRLTVPADCDGIYEIGACMQFDTGDSANAASVVGIRFLLNGATVIAEDLRNHYRAGAFDVVVSLTTQYDLDATDYVVAQVYTSRDVDVIAAANFSPEFWMTYLRSR